jgi:hypothetical protein
MGDKGTRRQEECTNYFLSHSPTTPSGHAPLTTLVRAGSPKIFVGSTVSW